jgi:hypothetical protein
MLKWFSGIDVNAVLAFITAVWMYLHNHSFRASQSTTPPKSTSPSAGASVLGNLLVVAMVVCLVGGGLALGALVAACSGAQVANDKAVVSGEEACLSTYGGEIAQAIGSAIENPSTALAEVAMSWQALQCMGKALHDKAPPDASVAPRD